MKQSIQHFIPIVNDDLLYILGITKNNELKYFHSAQPENILTSPIIEIDEYLVSVGQYKFMKMYLKNVLMVN